MKSLSEPSFNDLVERYLGTRLPPEMAAPVSMAREPEAAKAFIHRLLDLMRLSGYPPTSFTPYLIRWVTSIKTILPSAWGGRIPPLTMPGRHKRLDAYVRSRDRFRGVENRVFLDLGCGFPPVTTSDTAGSLPDWRVLGVDHSFPDYIVYNEEGHYACFDQNGRFQYFQALMTPSGRALYQDPKGTRKAFEDLFLGLKKQGGEEANESPANKSRAVEANGCRLIRNHIRDFETRNLSFIKSNIMDAQPPAAQAIRAMNLFIYFAPGIRKVMIEQICGHLCDRGLMIVGTNGLGVQARYLVYEKTAGGPVPVEFAFSPDNLGPISFMSWFTIHDNDPEALLLARLSGAIRSSDRFWPEFSGEVERLLARHELCRRGADGFFQVPDREIQYGEYLAKANDMWAELDSKGYVDGAVDILKQAGFVAWKNKVGDIAVRPDPGM